MHHIALSSPATAAAPSHPADDTRTAANEALIRTAFDAWRAGTGGVFDLLADDAQWTVAGDSPVSGVYTSKQDFLDRAVAPILARLATPIVPEVQHVLAQGDAVVVVWRGSARARDGSTYTNHYAWHMELEGGRIVRVIAFLDTWALDALME
ncbi:nuclear transport factor 2 family protein [Luteimonas viscosa]|uniref:Nuclear transport factor 2 family protein n=1 Tax=Luteimonas viscosa TaxID=1132694 RepID=A0A5D4XUC3_9GAMM|nr:nuclear transport factor 2 family protein [Luteimonas viscosa]TYT26592.1 nuclear transport factor 2 family protein [Luteimonas viscosa]